MKRTFFYLFCGILATSLCYSKPLTMAQVRIAFQDPVQLLDESPTLKDAFKKIMTPQDFGFLSSIRGPQDLGEVQRFAGEEVWLMNMSMAHYAVLQMNLGFAPPNRFWISFHGPWFEKDKNAEISSYYSTAPLWQNKIPEEWDQEAKKHPISKDRLEKLATEFTVDSSLIKLSAESCELKAIAFSDIFPAQVKNGGKKLFFKPCNKPCNVVDHKRSMIDGDEVFIFGPEVNSHRCGAYVAKNGTLTIDWLPLSGLAVQSKALAFEIPPVGEWKEFRINSTIAISLSSDPKSRKFAFRKGEVMSPEMRSNAPVSITFNAEGEASYSVRGEEGEPSQVRLLSKNPFLFVIPDEGYPMLYAQIKEKK